MRRIGLVVAMLFLSMTQSAEAQLGISKGTYGGYGYGFPNNTTFTSVLNASFGGAGNVSVLPDIAGGLGSFSSLLIDIRSHDYTGGSREFTATEATNLAAYISSGRRVLIFGDNYIWGQWNTSFLSLLGGAETSTSTFNDAAGTPLISNTITAGVTSIQTDGGPGTSSGGLSLFSNPYVKLWGSTQNVLTIQDINTCSDAAWDSADNATFCTNTANWLAEDFSAVPEPSSVVLMATGMLAIGWIRRRRNLAE